MSQSAVSVYPRGWFVVAFSSEIAAGQVKSARYFGEDLVIFRGEDGVAHVLDGFCVHMGANLGAGGKVCGNNLRCPFHGWQFAGTGECVEIPYAKKIPLKARQRVWLSREVNGVVLVWHDSNGGAPDFEIPTIEEHGTDAWLPWSEALYSIKTHPREIVDNLADKGHFPAVHATDIHEFAFEVDGHISRQRVKGTARLPGGGVDNFSSTTTYHGPGFLLMKMDGALQNYMLIAHTPNDAHTLDLRMGVMLKVVGNRARTEGYVGQYLSNLKAGFEDDIRIWETKLYRETPVLCDGDGPISQLRRWYRQFYVTAP
jgi:3-ketosteroid 9alpha-monooxygenase subunit A